MIIQKLSNQQNQKLAPGNLIIVIRVSFNIYICIIVRGFNDCQKNARIVLFHVCIRVSFEPEC